MENHGVKIIRGARGEKEARGRLKKVHDTIKRRMEMLLLEEDIKAADRILISHHLDKAIHFYK